ncbi:MAG: glycoside hydrolase family 3 C-terminal domain-containing protein, partial [Odoribacter sp.]|nr:glycoside hydrolase family 3 C-terminal domain-containing protein [Odoribacter sp.]
RILRLIFRTSMNTQKPWGSFATQEHAEIAKKIAEEGIVLLKNENNILPLNSNNIKQIAVIGENATRKMTQGGGSSELKPKKEVSPLEAIQERFGRDAKITHTLGYASGRSAYGREFQSPLNADSLKQVAIQHAQEADIVLYIGGLNKNHFQDCEGGDRLHYHLPFGQDDLLEAITTVNKNVVVVLITGNAVEMPWIKKVPAIVQAWYLGSEAGNAIASILAGDANPSGKLPFTFPVKLEDNGAHAMGELSYPGDSIKQVYKDDILVGYRWHDTKKIAPLFPFGFGLSYTNFEIGKPSIDKSIYNKEDNITVKVKVKNTGYWAGAEVVQFYVSDVKSSVPRPEKELKSFTKVMLEPGEEKEIMVEITVSSLAFYDEKISDWTVEPGDFVLHTGNSSRQIAHKLKFKVK